jgi:hypothetical protein
MDVDLELEGCWPDPSAAACLQTSFTTVVSREGTQRAMDQAITKMVQSDTFELRLQVLRVGSSGGDHSGGKAVIPSVLTTVASAYVRSVQTGSSSTSGSSQAGWLRGMSGVISGSMDGSVDGQERPLVVSASPSFYGFELLGPDASQMSRQQHLASQRGSLLLEMGQSTMTALCGQANLGHASADVDAATGRLDVNMSVTDVMGTFSGPCFASNSSDGGMTSFLFSGWRRRAQTTLAGSGAWLSLPPPPPPLLNVIVTIHAANAFEHAKRPATLLAGHPVPFAFNISCNVSGGAAPSINYSTGFRTSSLCRKDAAFPFTLTAPAPSFATALGDIDVTVHRSEVMYSAYPAIPGGQWENKTDVMRAHDARRPIIGVRGSQMNFTFDDNVTDPYRLGQMINEWYSTWLGLAFDIHGDMLIRPAASNPNDFSLRLNDITKSYSFVAGSSLTQPAFLNTTVLVSTDDMLRFQTSVGFDLSKSRAAGWGFPMFDLHFPFIYFVLAESIEMRNESFANFSTPPFLANHESHYLGPMLFTVEVGRATGQSARLGTFIKNNVINLLNLTNCSADLVSLTIAGNQDFLAAADGGVMENACKFQATMEPMDYSLYPGYPNTTAKPHQIEFGQVFLTSNASFFGITAVMKHTTFQDLRGLLGAVPDLIVSLLGTINTTLSMPRLGGNDLSLDASIHTENRPEGEVAAAIHVRGTQLAEAAALVWEGVMFEVSYSWSVAMRTLQLGQGVVDAALKAVADGVNECALAASPAVPQPLRAAQLSSNVAPLVKYKITSTASELSVLVTANVTTLLQPVLALIGDQSFALDIGKLAVELHVANLATGNTYETTLLTGEVMEISTEQVVLKAIAPAGPQTNAALSAAASDFIGGTMVGLVARLIVLGGHQGADKLSVDIDLPIVGLAGDATGCDGPAPPSPPNGLISCPQPCKGICQDGLCVNFAVSGFTPTFKLSTNVSNPLPIDITIKSVAGGIYARGTDTYGNPLNKWHSPQKFAQVTLANSVTIEAGSSQVRALCPFLRSLAAFSQHPPRCSVCGCVTALLTAGDPSRRGLP